MIDWIASHVPAWNGWLALCLYWMPLVLCAYGYLVIAVRKYRDELTLREKMESQDPPGYYQPELMIGTLVGYLLATVVPIANLIAAIFYIAPRVFGDFFEWIGKTFAIPLVPKRKP